MIRSLVQTKILNSNASSLKFVPHSLLRCWESLAIALNNNHVPSEELQHCVQLLIQSREKLVCFRDFVPWENFFAKKSRQFLRPKHGPFQGPPAPHYDLRLPLLLEIPHSSPNLTVVFSSWSKLHSTQLRTLYSSSSFLRLTQTSH